MKCKTSVAALRKRLAAIFKEWTSRSAEQTLKDTAPIWTAETLEDLTEMLDAVHKLIRQNLSSDSNLCTPGEEFFSRAERLMQVKLYRTYPSRHVSENLSDRQIESAAAAIAAEDIKALEPLSDSRLRIDYTMPLDDRYWRFDMFVGNLGYLCYVYADMAKRFGARETALDLLRLVNRFSTVRKNYFKRFKPEEVPEIVEQLRSAISALCLAGDYFALPEWKTFRAAEMKKLLAEEAEADAGEGEKGRK